MFLLTFKSYGRVYRRRFKTLFKAAEHFVAMLDVHPWLEDVTLLKEQPAKKAR